MNNFLTKQLYGKFPWTVVPIYKKDHYEYDGLVALGNKEARRDVIESYCWGSTENKFCDCCGKEYKKIPWLSDWGLCENCRNYGKPRTLPWDLERRI